MLNRCLRILLVLCLLPPIAPAQESDADRAQSGPETESAPATPAAPLPVRYTPDGNPILQDGTPIRLRLSRTLSSADCKTGDRIDFEVVEPILLDALTVVPQGSIAWGTVTDAEHKRRMTRGGKLAIEITEVQLANSQKAKLRADREAKGGGHTGVMAGAMVGTAVVFWPVAPVFLLMHGKDAKIPEGTEFTAYVDGDTPFIPPGGAVAPAAAAQAAAAAAGAPEPAPEQAAPDTSAQQQSAPEAATPEGAGPGMAEPGYAEPATTQLTFTSTPDGAEIELDGAFVGSTPSTIPLGSGDHTVRVTKKGYLPYERKLRTAGGTINLHADLEDAGP